MFSLFLFASETFSLNSVAINFGKLFLSDKIHFSNLALFSKNISPSYLFSNTVSFNVNFLSDISSILESNSSFNILSIFLNELELKTNDALFVGFGATSGAAAASSAFLLTSLAFCSASSACLRASMLAFCSAFLLTSLAFCSASSACLRASILACSSAIIASSSDISVEIIVS